MQNPVETAPLALIDGESLRTLNARLTGSRITIGSDDLREGLGWEIKPEGLCRDQRCVPVRERTRLAGADGIDVAELARVLGRPLAVDGAERTAVLGAAAEDRRARLASLTAPDFTLPDLDGRAHTLSGYRGTKVLLIAWASW
jgi:hypothetical protein